MKLLHVNVETDDGWLIGQGLEEPGIITQAKSLDELLANIREASQLIRYARDPYIVLVVPNKVLAGKRPAVRPVHRASRAA